MDATAPATQFRLGMGLVGLSLFTLPFGLLAIGGGPCAGPRNIAGAIILLSVGTCAVAAPTYGAFRILQNFKLESTGPRLLGAASILCACPAILIGGFYLLIGAISFSSYLRY
jgi:hypothetical protein